MVTTKSHEANLTHTSATSQLLEDSLIHELTRAMELPPTGSIKSLVHLNFVWGTRRFSELALGLDRVTSQQGSMAGVRWLLPHFVAGYEAHREELILRDGPLLIVSNHPASYDGMVISAFINRLDYKIIIGEIPPYRYLPHISRHIIFSPPVKNVYGRMQTVHHALRHLKDGGALQIFPRGGIEPDPAFMPNPDAEFDKWSRSLEVFLEGVPPTQVLVTTVSGVIASSAMRHPITWFRKERPDRQRLAFMYQIIRQVWSGKELFGLKSRVTFGKVLSSPDHTHILPEIEHAARRTLKLHLSSFGNDVCGS